MADVVYTVQPYDENEGLLGIACLLYGDEQRWTDIYEANLTVIGTNPNLIRAGQQLLIPGFSNRCGSVSVYRVQPHDVIEGLRGIARRQYGSVERWVEIYAFNRGVIGEDPERIQTGQHLILPL